MQFVIIYRNTVPIATVKPLDTSELSQQKQLEDVILLDFESDSYIDLQIGDYIIFDKTEQKYFLNSLPTSEEKGNFEYNCRFEGALHDLSKTRIMLDKDFNFPLTGNAKTFLQFIVENLNRDGGSYSVGTYEDTPDLTVDFVTWNAFEAINQLSSLLTFDWYLESNTLHFKAKNNPTPYVLNVGLKKGFTSLTRTRVESKEIATIVYGYGSTQNLPPRTGDGQTYNSPLLMNNRLFFNGVDGDSKLEKNISTLGKRESIQVFEDIKPERTGTITAIDAEDFNIFYDSGIDFNINEQKIEGIKPKVNFISGDLLGLEFNISYEDATKKVTLDTFTDESGNYPNEILKPSVGDQYKIYDVIMPQSYIDDAETRLREATQDYLDDHSKSMVIYEGELDPEFVSINSVVLNIGDVIRTVSPAFGIDNYNEIKALNQKITKPNEYKLQFGDILPKGLITLLQENNFNTEQSIYNISSTQITSNEVTNITGDENKWL